MKNRSVIFCLLAAGLLMAGCASGPRPVLERGWIGGRYDRAKSGPSVSEVFFGSEHTVYCFPGALAKQRNAGILTLKLSTNTPAYLAGVREGDLILDLGGHAVTNLTEFWQIVTESRPGAALPAKVYRDGQAHELTIIVGREKYQEENNITFGLPGYVEALHLVPTQESPEFSLVGVGYEKNNDPPAELGSVKEQFKQSCHPAVKEKAHDEDWRFWLAIMEVKGGKKILAQEVVAPEKSGQ